MAFGWDDAIGLLGVGSGLFGASSANKNQKKQNQLAEQSMADQQKWLNLLWPYQEADLGRYSGLQAGMDPARQKMLGWLQAMSGVQEGTNTNFGTNSGNSVVSPDGTINIGNIRTAGDLTAAKQAFLRQGGTDEQFTQMVNTMGQAAGKPAGWAESLPSGTSEYTMTTPGMSDLPAWLNPPAPDLPDLEHLMTPEQRAAIIGMGDYNATDYANQGNEESLMDLASRGLTGTGITGTADQARVSGTRNLLNRERTKNAGNLAMTEINLLDQFRNEKNAGLAGWRAEQAGGYNDLMNLLSGQAGSLQGSMDMSPYTNAAQNTTNTRLGLAQMYGDQASASAGNVGDILANLYAYQQYKKRKTTPELQGVSGGGATPASGINPWYQTPTERYA